MLATDIPICSDLAFKITVLSREIDIAASILHEAKLLCGKIKSLPYEVQGGTVKANFSKGPSGVPLSAMH